MIKALRCKRIASEIMNEPDNKTAGIIDIPCSIDENGRCVSPYFGGGECDAEEVAITPLAKHEEVQAALAAAKAIMEKMVKRGYVSSAKASLPWSIRTDFNEALTKIRKVSNG